MPNGDDPLAKAVRHKHAIDGKLSLIYGAKLTTTLRRAGDIRKKNMARPCHELNCVRGTKQVRFFGSFFSVISTGPRVHADELRRHDVVAGLGPFP